MFSQETIKENPGPLLRRNLRNYANMLGLCASVNAQTFCAQVLNGAFGHCVLSMCAVFKTVCIKISKTRFYLVAIFIPTLLKQQR